MRVSWSIESTACVAPKRRLPAPGALRLLAALTLLGVAACDSGAAPASEARPNILLISIDTLRADHLGSYGYERETSPNIDALAAQGVRFADCVSTSSWTLPAHMSMLTGLEVSAHGICDDALWRRREADGERPPLPSRGTFLPEVLRARGYRTAGFHSGMYVEERFGFGPGFELYEKIGRTIYWRADPAWIERLDALREAQDHEGLEAWMQEQPELFDREKPLAGDGVDQATAWIEALRAEQADEPFFVFLHLFDVHTDYVPPPPYDTLFDPGYEGSFDGTMVSPHDGPFRADMDPRDLEHVIALYDGEIAWVDSQLGRLFEWLEAQGLAQDTLVVLTSDHGEEFFEHGHKLHRKTLDRESIHVPLILRWPAALPAGVVVDEPTGIVDIASTIYSLLDVAPPPGLSGVDLGPLWRGGSIPERVVVSELTVLPRELQPRQLLGLHSRGKQLTRVLWGGELRTLSWHDLLADPAGLGDGELLRPGTPQWTDAQRSIDEVRAAIWRRRDLSRVIGGEAIPLSEQEVQDLNQLGYVVDGEEAETGPGSSSADEAHKLCFDGCVWQ